MEEQSAEEHQKKKRTQRIVWLIVAGFSVLSVIMWMNKDYTMSYDNTLILSAKALNLTCPKTVDDVTRLDSVAAKPGRRYFYYYTILNIEKDSMDIEYLCTMLKDNLNVNLKKESAETEEFGKNGVILNFAFKDMTADSLCTITMRPEEYSATTSTN